jgi:hypothetical protein
LSESCRNAVRANAYLARACLGQSSHSDSGSKRASSA